MRKKKILWIDDDLTFLQNTPMIFEKEMGDNITVMHNPSEALVELTNNYFDYYLVIVDLAMPVMDGLEMINQFTKLKISLPFIIASAHFGEPKWEKRLSQLGIELVKVQKPIPIVTSDDFAIVLNLINLEKKKYLDKIQTPFKFTYKDFINLNDEKRDELFELAFTINGPFIDNYFQMHKDTDWILIAKEPGKIIQSGKADKEPYQNDLVDLAQSIDGPVYSYSRPKVIEQIDFTWNEGLTDTDFYPTVCFEFINSEKMNVVLISDFDTGSKDTFLSYELLRKNNVIPRQFFNTSSGTLWGESFSYYRIKKQCKLLGKKITKDIMLSFLSVKNWNASPLVRNFPKRIGLAGRNLILENKIILKLDGEDKTTDIYK
ncbi:MAG: response regulator [Alphaproteobacteria bacterium]|nr:response regulator [Alphaproteobacteria bacterium]